MTFADCSRCKKHEVKTGRYKCPFPGSEDCDHCSAFIRVKKDLTTDELCRRCEKLQGTLFKLIAQLESIKLMIRGEV